ncbi:MAG TPA: hypothetical protein VHQ03_11525, partial [Candidatus Dormibacteraeota bacterium]|nr:hypothetical protein [Candidatus Dormibacteraeota bacterium]
MSGDYVPAWVLFAIFYMVPVAITYALPPGPGVGDALDEALFFVQVAAMVFVVASLALFIATRLAGRGPVVRLS